MYVLSCCGIIMLKMLLCGIINVIEMLCWIMIIKYVCVLVFDMFKIIFIVCIWLWMFYKCYILVILFFCLDLRDSYGGIYYM